MILWGLKEPKYCGSFLTESLRHYLEAKFSKHFFLYPYKISWKLSMSYKFNNKLETRSIHSYRISLWLANFDWNFTRFSFYTIPRCAIWCRELSRFILTAEFLGNAGGWGINLHLITAGSSIALQNWFRSIPKVVSFLFSSTFGQIRSWIKDLKSKKKSWFVEAHEGI